MTQIHPMLQPATVGWCWKQPPEYASQLSISRPQKSFQGQNILGCQSQEANSVVVSILDPDKACWMKKRKLDKKYGVNQTSSTLYFVFLYFVCIFVFCLYFFYFRLFVFLYFHIQYFCIFVFLPCPLIVASSSGPRLQQRNITATINTLFI